MGSFWAHLDSFWSFHTKLEFLLQITLAKKHFVLSRQKIKFCVKWSKRVQMVPKWPQMVKNMLYWSFGIILGPLRPLWDIGKPAMFGHFWPQKGHFGPLCAHDWRMAMAKTASNQLGICLRIMHVQRMPKVSIFMAVTTKIVPEKAQKWPKMARFWPKWRYNGRVMAREVFFHQCLWVTKFCAKFGRSRIPRTARAPNSFIILRCMWKEPAPFSSGNQNPWYWIILSIFVWIPTDLDASFSLWMDGYPYQCGIGYIHDGDGGSCLSEQGLQHT